jgi:ubiquinone/menaquinone biosynthesis C-methylase UbiE
VSCDTTQSARTRESSGSLAAVTGGDIGAVEAPSVHATQVFATASSSALYAQHFDPAFGRRIAARLIDALGIARGARVLDIASGTGVFARTAAHVVGPGGAVVAVDPSPAAVEAASDVDPTSSVAWLSHGRDLKAVIATARPFDVVACQHALHRLEDVRGALAVARDALVSGGRLGVTTWGPIEENPAFAALLDATVRSGIDQLGVVDAILAAFSHHDCDDLMQLAHDAGFSDVSCRTVRMLATLPAAAQWVRIQPLLPPLSGSWHRAGPSARRQFEARATDLLRPFEHHGVLHVHASVRVLVAGAVS